MSEPPAQHHLRGGEWRPLADQIAANVKNFVDGVEALARGGGDETVPLLLLEVSQILLAGAQLGASRDVIPRGNWEPEVGDDPDLDALRAGLATRLSAVDEYAEVFDPYADTSCLPFRISDDMAAVAADLIHGLKHYQAGRSLEALWWWQYSYFNHWGTHGGAALRALHAVVAHASLDVAEESTLLAGGTTPPDPPAPGGTSPPRPPLGGTSPPRPPLGGSVRRIPLGINSNVHPRPGGRCGAAVALVVQKYGGSSVADANGIKRVAQRIVATRKGGDQVVVVVSAMGDSTDELMDLASQVSPLPPARELDMLLTAGERISMALLAMAIATLGLEARSFTGSQAGVITDAAHGRARIIDIKPGRIADALADGAIPIVAGFQGVSQTTKDVTTMGRGASDTTAVALAAALDADACEIYTDVDGVFTADPRIVRSARRIPRISYEEMLEMAACGAKVLMPRCVEYARRYGVPIHVRSSFTNRNGTWVMGHANDRSEEAGMEQAIISGVAHDRGEAKITVVGVPDRVGEAAKIFKAVAEASINIDMIVQNVSAVATGRTDISFTLPRDDGQSAMTTLLRLKESVGFESLLYDDRIGKVSLIGAGMRSHPGVTARFFSALADAGVNIEMISTSEIRISVVVDQDDVDLAVTATHKAFELDSDQVEAVVYGGTGR
jgi:aspartate kinase